jgi:hypothetical protein
MFMKTGGSFSKTLFMRGALAVGALLVMVTLAVQAAEPTKKIEIVIKEGTAKVVTGYTVTGLPTEIVVRNEDKVTHGFNSSLFEDSSKVEMSGGSIAKDKGPHVYRVDAGKTLVLKFTPLAMEGSQSFAFWCDLHRAMKGEMLVVEMTGSGGG